MDSRNYSYGIPFDIKLRSADKTTLKLRAYQIEKADYWAIATELTNDNFNNFPKTGLLKLFIKGKTVGEIDFQGANKAFMALATCVINANY